MTRTSPLIIFDLGGVLIRHDNDLLFARLADCCRDPLSARRALPEAIDHQAIDCGRLSIDELHAGLVAKFGFAGSYARFLELWSSHFSEQPGMEPLVRRLARDHRVVFFSNTNAQHIAHVEATYPVMKHAHAAHYSYRMGLAKPDPASFRMVLELEGCAAPEAIFIDDRAENTASAAELGIRAITFADAGDFVAKMREYGVTAFDE